MVANGKESRKNYTKKNHKKCCSWSLVLSSSYSHLFLFFFSLLFRRRRCVGCMRFKEWQQETFLISAETFPWNDNYLNCIFRHAMPLGWAMQAPTSILISILKVNKFFAFLIFSAYLPSALYIYYFLYFSFALSFARISRILNRFFCCCCCCRWRPTIVLTIIQITHCTSQQFFL